ICGLLTRLLSRRSGKRDEGGGHLSSVVRTSRLGVETLALVGLMASCEPPSPVVVQTLPAIHEVDAAPEPPESDSSGPDQVACAERTFWLDTERAIWTCDVRVIDRAAVRALERGRRSHGWVAVAFPDRVTQAELDTLTKAPFVAAVGVG